MSRHANVVADAGPEGLRLFGCDEAKAVVEVAVVMDLPATVEAAVAGAHVHLERRLCQGNDRCPVGRKPLEQAALGDAQPVVQALLLHIGQ